MNGHKKIELDNKLKDYLSKNDNKMPVTRRDFIKAGLIEYLSLMSLSSLVSLTGESAHAFPQGSADRGAQKCVGRGWIRLWGAQDGPVAISPGRVEGISGATWPL